ncbi:MAG: type III polyketide synthase [bacterium]|nr:type III polyketide synthase [bacterium]
MSYIIDIQTAVPEFKHTQDTIANFYRNSTDDENIKRKITTVASRASIKTRYSVLNDFSKDAADFEFFPKNRFLEPEPSISERMDLFKKHACTLSIDAIKKIIDFESIKHSITHIITVTCTGLSAPGLDIEIVRELGLNPKIERNSVNFMGCNAAILALKNADYICKTNPKANVLIVCTELSTIHFQKKYSDDYIISTALFGDGSAAMIVSSSRPKPPYYPAIEIKAFHSNLLHKGVDEMAWHISDKGFVINLTSYVSQLINGSIKELFDSIGVNSKDVDFWAVHPGGKKILDDFRKSLDLSKEQLQQSYDVLNNFGNMSSPTVLFVLKQVIEMNKTNPFGRKIFTAAFGPGLSIETMQLEYV